MFSSRLPPRLAPNALSLAVAALRAEGVSLLDLTETNPTAVGLPFATFDGGLDDPAGAQYRPDPFGLPDARQAVARAWPDTRAPIDPAHVVLTASTSEAYAFLFKLLCDPGDEVLVPQPSYPLFEHLAGLEGVRLAPYGLDPAGAWCIDRDSVERVLTPASRALVSVSPNNPTGSMLRRTDRDWIAALAAEHGIALISDEVFAEYPLTPQADTGSLAGESHALTFALGGLSKSAGLPQMKLAWIAASGPKGRLADALARLELIADTYLSVSTPVQLAAARLIEAGRARRTIIAARLRENLAALRARLREVPSVSLVEPEGGWSVVLRVPAVESDESLVLRLLREARVLVHPGYFFDLPRGAFVVLSLLAEPAVFAEGTSRLLACVAGDPP